MKRMYSRKYYGKGRYYRGWSKYRKTSGTVARAAASGAAAKRADKQENLNITVQGYFNFNYGVTNPPLSNVIVFHPYAGGVDPNTGTVQDATLPIHGGAVNDRSFRLKCAQYDEVRLDQMKVFINPTVSNSSTTTPQMTVSTIWDRKAGPKECGITADIPSAVMGRIPTAQEVTSNEGAMKTLTNMNSTRGLYRRIIARNMQEKSFFWDSTLAYNTEIGEHPLSNINLDAWEKKDGAFCPALYVVSELNQTSVFGQSFTCSYRVEYNFTFRNPKSEMTDFIVNENPSQVNRGGAMRGAETSVVDIRGRSYISEWLAQYRHEKAAANALIAGTRSIEPVKAVEETKKTDEPMDVEDDPGTA